MFNRKNNTKEVVRNFPQNTSFLNLIIKNIRIITKVKTDTAAQEKNKYLKTFSLSKILLTIRYISGDNKLLNLKPQIKKQDAIIDKNIEVIKTAESALINFGSFIKNY